MSRIPLESASNAIKCPLCLADRSRVLLPARRTLHECAVCGLVFVRAEDHPTLEAERARYTFHRNSPDDPGYRAFLERLAAPLAAVLPPGAEGLDYGCGPGPTLSLLLSERGFRVAVHDVQFFPDDSLLVRRWAFVTCSEVIEHFRTPREELLRLAGLVEPGGWLGLSTPRPPDNDADLASWPHHRDPTHLCFYRPRTMEWLAAWLGFSLRAAAPGVWLLQRGGGQARASSPSLP